MIVIVDEVEALTAKPAKKKLPFVHLDFAPVAVNSFYHQDAKVTLSPPRKP